MTEMLKINNQTSVDIDRVLTISAVQGGVRLTYLNGEEETLLLNEEERNRLFDLWLGEENP